MSHHFLKAVSLKWLHYGNSGKNVYFKERRGGKELLIVQIQLMGQPAVMLFGWIPPTAQTKHIFFISYLVCFLVSTLCFDYSLLYFVNPKGNQPWIFIGSTDAEAHWKDLNAGRDGGQEEKGSMGDEMVGWHHQLNGHEFEQTPGDSEGQRSLVCCSPWSHKELDMT